jgi:membrane protein YdbS with pleckstrin-like domain
MFEIFKLCWDVVALRDASRKGLLTWYIWPIAFAFVAILYGVALSGLAFYQKHPQYKSVFVGAMVFDGVFYLCFMVWAYRWQARRKAVREAEQDMENSR